MPRVCTVCTHPARASIDKALVRREPYREITGQFSVSRAALSRHVNEHIVPMLAKAREQEDVSAALDVVKQLKAINGASLNILKEARDRKEPETALRAVDRIHKQIELQAKLLGDLDERPQVNLYLSPEWLELRATLVTTLESFPEAKDAVVRAIGGASNGSA